MIASTATRVSTEDSSFFQKVNPSAALAEGDFDMRRPPGTAGRFGCSGYAVVEITAGTLTCR